MGTDLVIICHWPLCMSCLHTLSHSASGSVAVESWQTEAEPSLEQKLVTLYIWRTQGHTKSETWVQKLAKTTSLASDDIRNVTHFILPVVIKINNTFTNHRDYGQLHNNGRTRCFYA